MARTDTAWRERAGGAALDRVSLDQMLERSGDAACVVGGDGRIIGWNREAERILGHAARDVIGRPCGEVFVGRDDHGNRLCYPACHVQTLARMGETIQSFDMRSQRKDGRTVWLNVSVLTADDRPEGGLMIHLFRDVTVTKELLLILHERLAGRAPGEAGAGPDVPLTRRELEVLRLLATGANTKSAAETLRVSRATVRNHVQNILGKLNVHSRLEAVAYANRHRLL